MLHRRNAHADAVGQAQAAPDGLLNQDSSISGAERNNGVEVIHVPAFLEHIDVDDRINFVQAP